MTKSESFAVTAAAILFFFYGTITAVAEFGIWVIHVNRPALSQSYLCEA